MADESEKKRRAAVAERLKAMFKDGEQLPVPDQMREAGERLDAEDDADEEDDEAAASRKTGRS